MPSLVILHARLRRSQTNKRLRHELRSWAFFGWPALNVPGTGRIDAQNGDTGCFDLGDDGREGFTEGSAEGEAEDSVDEEVGGFDGNGEVGNERNREVLKLDFEALYCFMGLGWGL